MEIEVAQRKFFRQLDYDISHYRKRHNIYVMPNQSDEIEVEDVYNVYKKFPFVCSHGIPISEVLFKDAIKLPLNSYEKKVTWKNNMRVFYHHFKKLPRKKRIKDLKYTHKGTAIVPVFLWKYLQLKYDDPDEYFKEFYDWYQSGNGNLCGITYDNDYYIIQSAGNKIQLNSFENLKVHREATISLEDKEEQILETKIYDQSSQYKVAVRQKRSLVLLDCDPSVDTLKLSGSFFSKVPFTCFDMTSSKICYSQADNSIHLTDIEFKKQTKLKKVKKKKASYSNWLSVQFMNSENIICTNASKVDIIDKRTPKDFVVKIPNRFKSTCDNFVASKVVYEDYLLVASYHNLYLYDLRSIKSGNECKCLMNWTHGFRSVPLHLNVKEFDEKLLITISNTKELCLMVYNLKVKEFYVPFYPNSMIKSLYNAQLGGFCLNIPSHTNRFRLPKNGCLLKNSENGFDLFSSNIAGDIFHYSLDFKSSQNNTHDNPEIIENWFKKLPLTERTITVSQFCDASELQKIVLSTKPYKINKLNYTKIWRQPNWIDENQLKNHQDICSEELLNAWIVTKLEEEPLPSTANTQSDIAAWLLQDSLNFKNEYNIKEECNNEYVDQLN